MTQEQSLAELERAARAALEGACGQSLSDDEWREARAELLLVARTLRDTLRDHQQQERAA